jgi:hypothetical protein
MNNTKLYIEKIPSKVINTFMIVIIAFFLIIIAGLLIIDKPDVVVGDFRLVANNQPYTLVAPNPGELILLVRQSQVVNSNQDICYIENAVDYKCIMHLDSIINNTNYDKMYYNLLSDGFSNKLGQISSSFLALRESIYNWIITKDDRTYKANKKQASSDLCINKQSIIIKNKLLNCEGVKLRTCYEEYVSDLELYKKGSITKTDYNLSMKNYWVEKGQVYEIKNDIEQLNQQTIDLSNKIKLLDLEYANDVDKAEEDITNKVNLLKNDIQTWKKEYVLTSPVKGVLEMTTFTEEKHFVDKGNEIMRILPQEDNLNGLVYIPTKDAGGIKNGSTAKLYLDSYSKSNYGYLTGQIYDISNSTYINQTGESFYWGKIKINFKQQPNFKGQFRFVHDMTGKADIIVKDKKLIFQIFNWLNTFLN